LWEYATGYKIISSPAISESIAFVGSTDANVYAFDARSGHILWNYTAAGGISGSSPTASGKIVYIGAEDKNLYAFEKTTGHLLWSFKADETITSTPLVYRGWLIVTSSDNTVYAFANHLVVSTIERNTSAESSVGGQLNLPWNYLVLGGILVAVMFLVIEVFLLKRKEHLFRTKV